MRGFFSPFAQFMQGRNGFDKLNIFILIVAGVLYTLNLLPWIRNTILMIIILLLLLLVILRAFSRNITKRSYENRRFTDMYRGIAQFFKRQWMKLRDIRTHRYVRCPYCKAQLRLKKRTGTQHISCPRCGKDFKKNILF